MSRFALFLPILLILSCGDSTVLYDSLPVAGVIQPDSATEAFIQPFRKNLQDDMAMVLVASRIPILRGKPDSPLGSLMADLILEEGKKMADSLLVAVDVCVLNIGGFRIDLPKGDITVAHVYELMPFENVINLVLLTEEGVSQMAKHLVAVGGQPTSGMRLRTSNGHLSSIEIGGKPYKGGPLWVVTSDYLADGGDHMKFFEERLQRIETGRMVRDVLLKQLAKAGAAGRDLNAPADSRIIIEP